MSCGNDRGSRSTNIHSNCVAEVVNHINDMQEAVQEDESCPTGCLNPLGGSMRSFKPVNTRPFILFTKEGFPFSIFTNIEKTNQETQLGVDCATQVFRVESVDGNCATLRGLVIEQVSKDGDGDKNNSQYNYNYNYSSSNNDKNKFVDVCDALADPFNNRIRGTNACVTVDLDCFCSIQCLNTLDDFIPLGFV
ncbi:MAG: CotY/CotZ family spore coat protein [Bacillaceae bacterium]